MRSKNASFIARLLVVLLLLQPLLGGMGVWSRASAQTDPPTPLERINAAVNNTDFEGLMSALTDPEAHLTLPEGFADWNDQADQEAVAMAFASFIKPTDEAETGYENLDQVQYILNLLSITYESKDAEDALSFTTIREKIGRLLDLSLELDKLFPNSSEITEVNGYQDMIDSIHELTPLDRMIYDYFVWMQFMESGQQGSPFALAPIAINMVEKFPTINRAQDPVELGALLDLLMQMQSQMQSPLTELGLDLSKAFDLTDEEGQDLVAWLFDQRPPGGYADTTALQSAFDSFFAMEPLRAVNSAIEANDPEDVLTALLNEELELKLPEAFADWNEDTKLSWAATIMNFSNGGSGGNNGGGTGGQAIHLLYTSLAQLQYIADLAARPVVLLDDQKLSTVSSAIDDIFAQIADFETLFPAYPQAEMLAQLGDTYNKMTTVEKDIYKYLLYLQLTAAKVMPNSGNNGNGIFTGNLLSFLLASSITYPSIAINSVSTTEQMIGSLQLLQSLPQMITMLEQQYDIELEDWNLDLSKIGNLNPADETMAELAEWMLAKRPEGGFADLAAIQSTFDQFFTPAAPSVTTDDNADKLVGADATMEYSTDDGKTWTSYDPEKAPVFSGYVTVLVRVKENGVRNASPTTTVSFNAPYVYVPSNNTETRYVDVQGSDGTGLARTPVTRTTDASGKVTDSVTLSADIAKEAVDKAKAQGGSTVRIAIPDAEDKVSEVSVTIPAAALTQINDGKMSLELSTGDGIVSIPTASLSGFGQDLYFRLVPVKTEDGRVQIETRAKQEKAVQDYVKDESIKIYGRPMQIETNLQSREANLFLPLKNGLPTDTAERNRIMNHLGVYAEHSDGTKELIQGKVVTMNNMTGIQFTVQKFSTFAIVYADGLNGTQTQTPTPTAHTPYINGFGADFRPNAFVTRAQMAAMLARNLPDVTASAGMTAGSDVKAGHWATDEIVKAKSAGIMGGVSDTMFDPEGSVTRAQMAAIAARWMQKGPTTSQGVANPGNGNYSDVADSHWAADAISYVTSAGIMTGYAGQTFKPDQKLTRAEAVKVLNRLFGRGPLNGATTVTFTDVPATHWAFADIEEAATNHKYTVDAQGAEQIAVQ